jgi:hypothetical protein
VADTEQNRVERQMALQNDTLLKYRCPLIVITSIKIVIMRSTTIIVNFKFFLVLSLQVHCSMSSGIARSHSNNDSVELRFRCRIHLKGVGA